MKRAGFFALLSAGLVACATAADIGTFVNLGFSPDSSMFAFGVYSVSSDRNTPHAELYIVDVQRNVFSAKGQFEYNGPEKVSLGQDGSSGLFKLIGQSQDSLAKTKIDHDRTGRLVYLLLNGEEPKETLSFKDFNTGINYTVNLTQTINVDKTKDSKVAAAFAIGITTQGNDGITTNYKVGKAGYFRDQVASYKIRQIILTPNEGTLIFVIEKLAPANTPIGASYMIETLPLH